MKVNFLPLCLAAVFLVANSAGAQDEYYLPACGKRTVSQKFVGDNLRLYLPANAVVKSGRDVDYADYYVGFGQKKNRVWLRGIYGPTASSGKVPEKRLSGSTSVSKRIWKFGEAEGIDVKASLPNGNFWRFVGRYGEQVEYYDVPKGAADYFDSILDNLCYQEWEKRGSV